MMTSPLILELNKIVAMIDNSHCESRDELNDFVWKLYSSLGIRPSENAMRIVLYCVDCDSKQESVAFLKDAIRRESEAESRKLV